MVTPSVRLIAIDIDGTLLNSQFQIAEMDLNALRRAQTSGVEVIVVTGRRHMFSASISGSLVPMAR
jgi:hydroxymethylpyrimidine pyrophosphatase-like HAD family hydrolase